MTMFSRRYGAHPLHLLAMVASFALAGYAALLLVKSHPVGVIVWFIGAAVGHDLLFLPLYAIADKPLIRASSGRAGRPGPSPWINYVRVPAMLSGLLLLVYLPSIASLSTIFTATTALSSSGYFIRWLGITGVLFLLSGLTLAVQLRRNRPVAQDSEPA